MSEAIKVLLIEDHAGYREVIARTLQSSPKFELLHQFGTAEIALREIQKLQKDRTPDILILDLNLPGISGLEAIPWFKKYSPSSEIIILTQSDREADVLSAISQGASGYLLKSATAQQIKDAIQIVSEGRASLDPSVAKFILNQLKGQPQEAELEKALSSRELEILNLLSEGMVKKEIAAELNIGVSTVAYHIKHIYQKLEVRNAPAAVSKGHRKGIL